MGGYLDTMLRYFEFSGRSSRSQYWLFQLFALLMIIAAVAFDMWRGVRPQPEYFGPVTLFVVIIHAVPQITVAVRRLHDVGRSGWWYLLNFVPFGALVLLVWACQASEEGTNEFGDGPSGAPREKRRPSGPCRRWTESENRVTSPPVSLKRGGL